MATQNLITEQFLTIQGEGRSIGQLAYFIRLAGCNLWCEWCDSMHSVDPLQFKGQTAPVDYSKIPSDCHLFVLTGGEPSLFNLIEIKEKLQNISPNCKIEVESNATRFNPNIADEFFWNLSPKLSTSKQKNKELDQKRLIGLNQWTEYVCKNSTKNNVIFKFVITCAKDLEEVLQLVREFHIPRHLVYLMAEGQTTESQSLASISFILNFAKVNFFNFSPRLHIMYWGKMRGV